jgi:hypothetical protein
MEAAIINMEALTAHNLYALLESDISEAEETLEVETICASRGEDTSNNPDFILANSTPHLKSFRDALISWKDGGQPTNQQKKVVEQVGLKILRLLHERGEQQFRYAEDELVARNNIDHLAKTLPDLLKELAREVGIILVSEHQR